MRSFATLLIFLFCPAGAPAQTSEPGLPKLGFLLSGLFGPDGLVLPSPNHQTDFADSFAAYAANFPTAVGRSELTSLPLPSPASGFTYSFDPSLGVYSRSKESYGPILAERAETIGKEKFFVGFSYEHYHFNTLDGLDLNSLPAVFEASPSTSDPRARQDIITTRFLIDAQVDRYTIFFTYGVTDRMDVSVAVPSMAVKLAIASNAAIQRIGTASNPEIHYFLDSNGNIANHKNVALAGAASGLSDLAVRVKITAAKWRPVWLALGADARVPTGDVYNLLSSGAFSLRPFLVLSGRGRFAPHVNAGYVWNGSSVLAGNLVAGTRGHLPNELTYGAGFDAGFGKKFSLSADIVGLEIWRNLAIHGATFTGANGVQYAGSKFSRTDTNITDGSVGFKINPVGTVLVSFNMLIQLNNGGLRSRVVPLVGLSYAF